MKFLQKLFGKKESRNKEPKGDEKNAVFKKKYQSFQELLLSNNDVLNVIADMEERLSSAFLVDSQYLNQSLVAIANGVRNIIANLNQVSNNKYLAIHETFNGINAKIDNLLAESDKDKPLDNTLERLMDLIIPLNICDSGDEKFRPESCQTLHDIIWFCNEIVRQEMFKLTEIPFKELGKTIRLVAGIPLHIHLIDLGGGIEGNPKYLYPEHISSFPFRAFLNGLIAMKWPEPPPVDVGGLLGMIGHTLTIPEEEIIQTGESSFSFISSEYMNCAIRLGYHFSSIEAYTGNNLNDNYIRIFFKGGGAVIERRMRRVRLITEILKKMDFGTIKITEDVIDAVITHDDKSALEKKLEVLGKLTAYTKQQDMAMYNDAITDFYIKEFLNQHLSG